MESNKVVDEHKKKEKFYVVARGRNVGIFRTWEECEALVKGYSENAFKSFLSEEEATKYLNDYSPSRKSPSTKPGKRPAKTSHADKTTKRRKNSIRSRERTDEREADSTAGRAVNAERPPGCDYLDETTEQIPDSAVYLYSDGACQREQCGAGFVIKDSQQRVLYTGDVPLPADKTNNQAEYKALIFGLEECIRRGYTSVVARVDSKLLVGQIMHKWKINFKELEEYNKKVKELISKLSKFTMQHIYRDYNEEADALSKQALGIPVSNGERKAPRSTLAQSLRHS